jgi:hypothetical protein
MGSPTSPLAVSLHRTAGVNRCIFYAWALAGSGIAQDRSPAKKEALKSLSTLEEVHDE